jgi:3-oxoacyl-[acyl-carrier protein] reductase
MDEQEFATRVAIITGGGRGFGKAFGHALAARGAHAVLVDLDGPAAEEAAGEIRAAGGLASAYEADVADEAGMTAVVASVVGEFGGIDILINNAGLQSAAYNEPMATSGMAKLRRLFDVNLIGTINCTLAAQDAMKGRPGASIVNISSLAAYGAPTAYGISKLAVQGVTMTSAGELGQFGIRVNAIAPGLIFTDTIRAELAPAVVEMVMARQAIPQEGEERDIVEAMLYLVSDRASFVTGETIRVSGGVSMHV